MQLTPKQILFVVAVAFTLSVPVVFGQQAAGISSAEGDADTPAFDLVQTSVTKEGDHLVFGIDVSGQVGEMKPAPTGQVAGSNVYSYVWPTSQDSSTVGFEAEQGTLALAATSHPDFDDTPLYDENGDSDPNNDGDLWHSHWVVLVPDDACGEGNLKVRDIPKGAEPTLPATWPELPILIDSPDYAPSLQDSALEIRVPLADLGFPETFNYDGVTSALRVNADMHQPFLCVVNVWDVASGDLSLPGEVR